jgi:serine/threonine protein kinase
MMLEVGSLVGMRYVIEEHISSGGFGAVYRASDREIRHHQVALKILHRPSASEEEQKAALRELKLIASVAHPSVVQFKEYGWHQGRLWFAMPWYRGKTLDRILGDGDARAAMSRSDARLLFTRIAHGLAAMHAMGIQHHDIKPENIFVAQIAGFPAGLPVLLDLGIATQRGENPIGLTVEYASPETAAAMLGEATAPIGGAADVYSLALVLRNALDPDLAEPVYATDIMPVLRARATYPARLSKKRKLRYLRPYFERWLSQDPTERPTAAELASELAVLTAPEDRRHARLRTLKRMAPMLFLTLVMVSALVLQLREQETALVVTSRELAEQREVGDALRRQAEAQLDQLEINARKLGNERKQLGQTLALARQLNGRLSDAAKRYEELDVRHAELKAEREDLSLELLRVTDERDKLTAEKQTLAQERARIDAENEQLNTDNERLSAELEASESARDTLTKERDTLTKERDTLAKAQSKLTQEHDDLEKERDALTKERDALAKEQSKLTRELAAKDEKQESTARKRDEALAEVRALEGELTKAKAEQRQLENRVRVLEARPAQAKRAPAAKKPAKKPAKRARARRKAR